MHRARSQGIPAQIQRSQDGEEAIRMFSQIAEPNLPHIVIIDLNLPKVTGLERELSLQLGADAYIAKPPTRPELFSMSAPASLRYWNAVKPHTASVSVLLEPTAGKTHTRVSSLDRVGFDSGMKPNLDILKPEIELYLEETGLAVFYGYSRPLDAAPAVYWDCDQYPDYQLFVQAARAAGAKLIVFHQREFFPEQIDEAIERLHACELPAQDSRQFEERLNELRAHEGSVCAIELSFDHQGRVFLFDLRTEWFDEFSEIQDEIQLLIPDPDDGDDESPIGGYFSRN